MARREAVRRSRGLGPGGRRSDAGSFSFSRQGEEWLRLDPHPPERGRPLAGSDLPREQADVALHDVAAVKVIVEEAGGVFVSREDAPLESGFQEAVMSSNRSLATELRRLLGF